MLPLSKRRAMERIVTQARSKWRIAFEPPPPAPGREPVLFIYDAEYANGVTSLGQAWHRLSQEHPEVKRDDCIIRMVPVHREREPS